MFGSASLRARATPSMLRAGGLIAVEGPSTSLIGGDLGEPPGIALGNRDVRARVEPFGQLTVPLLLLLLRAFFRTSP